MRLFVKLALLSLFGLGCLALNTGAQSQPLPPTPAATPVAPQPPVVFQTQPLGSGAVAGRVVVAQPVPGYPLGGDTLTLRAQMPGQDHTMAFWYTPDGSDLEAKKLAKQLTEAKTETEKDKLKEKLKELLNKQFDDRQKRHEKDIESLEIQVKKLKEMVDKRKENKKDIIDERTKQLQREAAGLGW